MFAMNSSFCFITIFAIIALFICVQSFPTELRDGVKNSKDTVYLIPRHSKRNSIYGLYRYIPKMDENKIKKDYDDAFEGGYARYYFTE